MFKANQVRAILALLSVCAFIAGIFLKVEAESLAYLKEVAGIIIIFYFAKKDEREETQAIEDVVKSLAKNVNVVNALSVARPLKNDNQNT